MLLYLYGEKAERPTRLEECRGGRSNPRPRTRVSPSRTFPFERTPWTRPVTSPRWIRADGETTRKVVSAKNLRREGERN